MTQKKCNAQFPKPSNTSTQRPFPAPRLPVNVMPSLDAPAPLLRRPAFPLLLAAACVMMPFVAVCHRCRLMSDESIVRSQKQAAGIWSGRVARWAGQGDRSLSLLFAILPLLLSTLRPNTIDQSTSIHLHSAICAFPSSVCKPLVLKHWRNSVL